VALIYLLLVLGGSVAGGRTLGVALACGGFFSIDYFFQFPYDEFSVGKPFDWTALVAFLATSAVTSELVTRALCEAEAARRRADEVARLSRLGSRALHAGRARDALAALAELIRGTLGVPDCEIYRSGNGGEPVASAVRARDGGGAVPVDDGALVAWVAQHGRAAVVRADGTTLQAFAPSTDDDAIGVAAADARTVLVPLQVEARTVGVLRLADRQPMVLDAARRRFLTALSRLRGGVFPVTLEPNTAEDVVGAVTRQLQPVLGGHSIATSIDMTQPALVGRFDFVQTLRILSNLVENALRYSPPRAPVELGVTRQGGSLLFTVADRGPGIPAEDRERIFAPFFRSPTAAPDAGRAGLGLSIARRLAEAQGGRVRYEPRPGGGSVFVLELEALDLPAGEAEEGV